jgi:hypothetical protein
MFGDQTDQTDKADLRIDIISTGVGARVAVWAPELAGL